MLFLSIVTTWTEALVISGNTFLFVCVKEVFHPCVKPHFDTLNQFLITAKALWSQSVLQVGE
jgi:hypothetical protein